MSESKLLLLEKTYLKHDGVGCLNCMSRAMKPVSRPRQKGFFVYHMIRCRDCGASWTDIYELSRVTDVELPKKKEPPHE